jgi:hypothetical protein
MSTIRGRTLGLALLAVVAIACGRTPTPRGAVASLAPAGGGVTVVVDNHNFAEMDVYVVRAGDILTRLGMVDGESKAQFLVDPSLFPTGTLGLLARPIGGFGAARSGPIPVGAGETVTFTIEPDLRASMATVR